MHVVLVVHAVLKVSAPSKIKICMNDVNAVLALSTKLQSFQSRNARFSRFSYLPRLLVVTTGPSPGWYFIRFVH